MSTGDYVGVGLPDYIFVIVGKRTTFDKIERPVTDHGDQGRKGHVLTKSVDHDGFTVCFQHWVKDPSFPSPPDQQSRQKQGD